MSTKVYKGFRFRSSDLSTIHAWIMEWREELHGLHLKALSELIADFAVTMVDDATLAPGKHDGESPLVNASMKVMDRQNEIKKTSLRDPQVDFEFNLCIMPYGGEVYGIVYTERWNWCDLWMEKDYVADFSYWNTSDHPDGMTEEEWEHRSEVWHDLLAAGVRTVPSMCGFSADCTHEMTMPTTEEVMAAIPSFERRVKKHADHAVMSAEFARRREVLLAETPPEDEKYLPSLMFGLVSQCQTWLSTDDGKALLAIEMERIGSMLKPEIGKNDLIDPITTKIAQAPPEIEKGEGHEAGYGDAGLAGELHVTGAE